MKPKQKQEKSCPKCRGKFIIRVGLKERCGLCNTAIVETKPKRRRILGVF